MVDVILSIFDVKSIEVAPLKIKLFCTLQFCKANRNYSFAGAKVIQIRIIRIFVDQIRRGIVLVSNVPAPRSHGSRPASRLWTTERWTRVSVVLQDQPPVTPALP